MEGRWESISFPGKASVLLTFVQTISLESLCYAPFLPFGVTWCLKGSLGWMVTPEQFLMCFSCSTTILHTKLEVTLKDVALFSSAWYLQRKLACYCSILIQGRQLDPSSPDVPVDNWWPTTTQSTAFLSWQFDDRCLLSMRCFETRQWSLCPKCCKFSKYFVIFETSRERMHVFLCTYSSVCRYSLSQLSFLSESFYLAWKCLESSFTFEVN